MGTLLCPEIAMNMPASLLNTTKGPIHPTFDSLNVLKLDVLDHSTHLITSRQPG